MSFGKEVCQPGYCLLNWKEESTNAHISAKTQEPSQLLLFFRRCRQKNQSELFISLSFENKIFSELRLTANVSIEKATKMNEIFLSQICRAIVNCIQEHIIKLLVSFNVGHASNSSRRIAYCYRSLWMWKQKGISFIFNSWKIKIISHTKVSFIFRVLAQQRR